MKYHSRTLRLEVREGEKRMSSNIFSEERKSMLRLALNHPRRRGSMNHAFIVALMCFMNVAIVGCKDEKWSDGSVEESWRRGDVVITALKTYNKDHGVYPQTLADLVPRYLQKIEPPTAGNNRWVYKTKSYGTRFTLIFEDDSESQPTCWKSSDDSSWNYDTK